MADVIYKELISDMVWSYSRIKSFEDCPYRWFLHYIKGYRDEPRFFSSYGTLCHKLLERFYSGNLEKNQLSTKFLLDFQKEIQGARPPNISIEKYIKAGTDYFDNFTPLPYQTVSVEKVFHFEISGNRFVGLIDYLGTDGGDLIIVDHKSGDIKPRSKRKNPTQKDLDLDEKLKQLYIYAAAVHSEYGKFPKSLCFNCFRTQTFIEEPFVMDDYEKTLEWTTKSIEKIKNTDDFYPNREYFACRYICGQTENCCYF